jgi:Protein of unknown function, DUF547
MKKITVIFIGLAALALAAWRLVRNPAPKAINFDTAATTSNPGAAATSSYAAALKTYVNDQGMVNYRGLQADRAQLDAFAASVGRLDLKVYDGWGAPEKVAFLINAYNALTLEAILANYPIKPSVTGAMLYPKNSIRQIPGVWDRLEFQLLGKPATLDDIEHRMLRKQFNEPRIHMALVCASIGCPTLRNEPYVAERLSEQLDDQTRKFISNPLKFRIDRQARVVHLSPLFKWYGGDFVKSFGTDKFAGHSDAERAALNYLSALLEPADREFLEKEKIEIKYLDYNWSLNEQGGAY